MSLRDVSLPPWLAGFFYHDIEKLFHNTYKINKNTIVMIKLNGSKFEGGGQIVRTALALSAITQKPFKIHSIRKGRDKPGLKAQHLHCIKALEQLCNAKAEGNELYSENLSFTPDKIKSNNLEIDIGTAGSVTLLLQSLILPCLYSPSTITIKVKGGTDVKWSPQTDYFSNVFLPNIEKYAEKIDYKLSKRGYYPKGNGEIEIKVRPKKELEGKIELTKQGKLTQIKGISHASRDLLKAEVAERQSETARLLLKKLNVPVHLHTEYPETDSTGSGISLFALFSKDSHDMEDHNRVILGTDVLGEKGKKSEEVAKEAVNKLLKLIDSKTPVDPNLADQLVPFIALFGGRIKTSEITGHIKANAYVCNEFLDYKLVIDEEKCIIQR